MPPTDNQVKSYISLQSEKLTLRDLKNEVPLLKISNTLNSPCKGFIANTIDSYLTQDGIGNSKV